MSWPEAAVAIAGILLVIVIVSVIILADLPHRSGCDLIRCEQQAGCELRPGDCRRDRGAEHDLAPSGRAE